MDQTTIDNFANFVMMSNFKDAVMKTLGDRRYAVFYTAQQTVEDLALSGMDGQYFRNLHEYYNNGGYAAVAEYYATRPITIDVQGRAPNTSSTAEALSASLNAPEQILLEAIESQEMGFGELLSSVWVKQLMDREYGRKLTAMGLARTIEALGYIKHPALDSSDGRMRLDDNDHRRHRVYVKKGSELIIITSAQRIKSAWDEMIRRD